MSGENRAWLERSRHAVWHPCTQMKVHESLVERTCDIVESA